MKTTIKDRSDEELNRTIAEWMGWKFVPEHDVSFITPAGHAMPEGWTDPEGEPYSIPPNYCRDLNACHEAEGRLTDEQQFQMVRALIRIDNGFDTLNKMDPEKFPDREQWVEDYMHRIGWDEVWSYCIRATARQRAEALVAVIEQQKGEQR